jgi:DNA-binding beta-propeller fold protein YncE
MSKPKKVRHQILTFAVLLFVLATLPMQASDARSKPVLAIAYMGDSQLAIVDGSSYETLATLPTGEGPHEVRISPDGARAYVAAGKTITVVDLDERKVRGNFDLGSYAAHDIRVSRDGKRIWAACAGAKAIVELDADTGKVLASYPTKTDGSWFVEITPDEQTLVAPNLEGKSVSIIDRATSRVTTIPFQNSVYGIDVTKDGKEIWVTGRDVTIIDPRAAKVVATITLPERDTGRIRLTSKGKAVVALERRLAVIDVKTRKMTSLIELQAAPKVLTVASDDRHVFLTNPDDHTVSVVDIKAGKQVKTFKTGLKPDGIGWAD